MTNNIVKIAENETHILKVLRDYDAENPRVDFSNFGKMICWHNRYNLGDEHDYNTVRDFRDSIGEEEGDVLMLPLYLFDHSGITMNTTGFVSNFDSGQVGFICISHNDIIKEFGELNIELAKFNLINEVKTYDRYLTGDVYGYTLEEKNGCDCCGNVEYNETDSCWGYYGLENLEEDLIYSIGENHRELVNSLKDYDN